MKKSKKTSSASSKEKQKSLIELLKSYGAKIYEDLDNGEFPKFSIPSRSVSNIVYDQKLRQYILGNNSAIRSAKNTSQLRSFTQLMWLAFFANRLTKEKKSSTLRDVYYSSQAFEIDFEDQGESDNIIVDLEAVLSRPREDFHVFPEERSSRRAPRGLRSARPRAHRPGGSCRPRQRRRPPSAGRLARAPGPGGTRQSLRFRAA